MSLSAEPNMRAVSLDTCALALHFAPTHYIMHSRKDGGDTNLSNPRMP